MARSYYANVPISEPTPQGFTLNYDFGGIGWDQKKGMFIPSDGEISMFSLPEPRPADFPNQTVNTGVSAAITALIAANNDGGYNYSNLPKA